MKVMKLQSILKRMCKLQFINGASLVCFDATYN